MVLVQRDDGDWFTNLIFWWIGQLVFSIVGWIGQILALFTDWQWGYDNIVALIPEFSPPGLGTAWEGDMKLGV